MKPNNASEDRRLRAETANENLKQDTQTHDSGGLQAMLVLHMAQIDALSQQQHVLWKGVHLRATNPSTFPLRI